MTIRLRRERMLGYKHQGQLIVVEEMDEDGYWVEIYRYIMKWL